MQLPCGRSPTGIFTWSPVDCAHGPAGQAGPERGEPGHPGCRRADPAMATPSPDAPTPRPRRVPEPAALGQQHVQVALQGVLVEGAAQPGAAAAHVRGDVAQGVEALELVLAEHLLHVEPEHGLCGERGPRRGAHIGCREHSGVVLMEVQEVLLSKEKEDTREYTQNKHDPRTPPGNPR